MDLLKIDLNLLASLDVLLDECNVTRAARRLHISQPAMSAQLARLRGMFDDPLLLPAETGRGMTPTALGLSLRTPLAAALKALESVVRLQPSFAPETDQRTFQVAASDNAMIALGLPLIGRLAHAAGQGVRLAFRAPQLESIAAQMERGEIDLLIDAERVIPPHLKTRTLAQERFVMAQRKGHPRGTAALDLDGYCALHHVLVSSDAGSLQGYMDEYLTSLQRQRDVVLAVPQIMLAPRILRDTDYVCTLPAMLLKPFSEGLDLFELPFPAPVFTLKLAWHPRNQLEPAVSWLRDLICQAVPG